MQIKDNKALRHNTGAGIPQESGLVTILLTVKGSERKRVSNAVRLTSHPNIQTSTKYMQLVLVIAETEQI